MTTISEKVEAIGSRASAAIDKVGRAAIEQMLVLADERDSALYALATVTADRDKLLEASNRVHILLTDLDADSPRARRRLRLEIWRLLTVAIASGPTDRRPE